MSAQTETFAAGLPVEIGKIGRELKKLWDQGDGIMTRASLINLAIYSEAPGSLPLNTEIISQITEDHACRAIVIAANPSAAEDRVEAWISAHCHISRAGSKQVCSEQLSFSLAGSFAQLLPSLVFSHLDSDLPFLLWWQGEFQEPMDPQLWARVDRAIYDSQDWKDANAQIQLLQGAQADAQQRIVLCDLNWTRLVQIRLALAQFFDHPACHDHLAQLQRLEIDFAPGYRSTALLLAGWLAAQLRWQRNEALKGDTFRFIDQSSKPVEVALREMAGEPLSRCVLTGDGVEFRVSHAAGADLLEISSGAPGEDRMHQLMPAGSNHPVRLMTEELMRGGPHRVYLRALNSIRDLL